MEFKDRFKQLRIEMKLTQEEVAYRLLLSPATIGLYEQGRREPNIKTLKDLSTFFNVSIDYLVGKSDTK